MRRGLVAVIPLLLVLAACAGAGGDPGTLDAGEGGTTAPTRSPAGPPEAPPSTGTKPDVTVPDGPPPTELVTEDLIEGDGPGATTGDTVLLHYVGVVFSTKQEFDSTWERGTPVPVTLGTGGVIDGWEQGIPGMKVGGRRMLVIPPDLAYGADGYPPSIGPNETLVFVLDLVSIQ